MTDLVAKISPMLAQTAGAPISDVVISRLTPPVSGFDHLTYPRLRPMLAGREPAGIHSPDAVQSQSEAAPSEPDTSQQRSERLILGAWIDGVPAGLAWLSARYGEARRRLWSLAVATPFRRRGIGLKLLAASEQAAIETGTKLLVAIHSSRMANRYAYETLMRNAGWSAPEAVEYRLAGRASWVIDAMTDWAPFLDRVRSDGFTTTLWSEVNDADREQIKQLVGTLPDPDKAFDPARCPLATVPEISVVLRRGEEIVGWILGVKPDLDRYFNYTHGYVIPRLQRRGWLIAGLVDVCRRQVEAFGSDTVACYETNPDRSGMTQFMQRRLGPRSPLWTDVRYKCEKELG